MRVFVRRKRERAPRARRERAQRLPPPLFFVVWNSGVACGAFVAHALQAVALAAELLLDGTLLRRQRAFETRTFSPFRVVHFVFYLGRFQPDLDF